MSDKLIISMTSSEGITLNTKGSYIDKDIAIVPQLEDITVTPTTEEQVITASDGNVGIGSVKISATEGVKINGIIERHKVAAGATVIEGDFVEIAEHINELGVQLPIDGGYTDTKVLRLDENRAIFIYPYAGTASLVMDDGDKITLRHSVTWEHNNKFTSCTYCVGLKLTENQVLLLYTNYKEYSSLYARLLTIENDTITIGPYVCVGSPGKMEWGSPFDAAVLNDHTVICVTKRDESIASTAYIINIDGETISRVSSKSLNLVNADAYPGTGPTVTALSESRVVIGYSTEDSYQNIGLINIVNGIISQSNNTYSTGVRVNTPPYTFQFCRLDANRVIGIPPGASSVRVYTISADDTITETIYSGALVPASDYMSRMVFNTLGEGQFVISYCVCPGGSFTKEAKFHASLLTFADEGTLITSESYNTESIANIPQYPSDVCILNYTKEKWSFAFHVFNTDFSYYRALKNEGGTVTYRVTSDDKFAQLSTSNQQTYGIAKTSGVAGDTIDVFVTRGDYPFTTTSTSEISSGTELTATVACNAGDLIIAAIVTRDTLTLSDGWTLISTSEINSIDTTNGQRLSWAYKFADSTTEAITVTQASSQRLYIIMVSIPEATGVTDNGYTYSNTTSNSMTVDKPSGVVLWGVTTPAWTSGKRWDSSSGMVVLQDTTSSAPRLAIGLDCSNKTSATFIAGASAPEGMIVGSLTIQGINRFY